MGKACGRWGSLVHCLGGAFPLVRGMSEEELRPSPQAVPRLMRPVRGLLRRVVDISPHAIHRVAFSLWITMVISFGVSRRLCLRCDSEAGGSRRGPEELSVLMSSVSVVGPSAKEGVLA